MSPGDGTDCMAFITEGAEGPVNSEGLCSLYCASFQRQASDKHSSEPCLLQIPGVWSVLT